MLTKLTQHTSQAPPDTDGAFAFRHLAPPRPSARERRAMSLNNPSVAIVGATGAVGTELITCLEQRDFHCMTCGCSRRRAPLGESWRSAAKACE